MLVLVQQGQLIDEDSSQGESCGVGKPFGGHLALPIEDALELPALKFSMARERSSWKTRLTPAPGSACGYGPCREATKMRSRPSHNSRTSGAL